VSPAKTAEPIEMPFGLWARVGPRKHVLGPDAACEKGILREGRRVGAAHCKVYGPSAVSCAKMTEPIVMPLTTC